VASITMEPAFPKTSFSEPEISSKLQSFDETRTQ
jgi:hypothetical protein